VRTWIQKLGSEGHLAFSGQDELKMLLDLYDENPTHPIQYHFDNRFKGRLPGTDLSLCSTATSNLERNRTKENYPTDEGLLHSSDNNNNIYINASKIEGKDRSYIATQHPLPSTVSDFWKMVLFEKPAVVVMLNKDDYDRSYQSPDEPELVQYWPGTSKSGPFIDSIFLEDKETGGTVKITVLPEPLSHNIEEIPPNSPVMVTKQIEDDNNSNNKTNNKTNIDNNNNVNNSTNTQDVKPSHKEKGIAGHQEYKLNKNIEYSRLHVEYEGQQHQLWHIRCGGWKDQEAPDLDLFMDLWNLVQEKLKSHKMENGEKHKIVIHCTGGVGRTGTFIAVDIAGQELKEKQQSGKWEEFSMEKVIHFLRKKRMNMVGSISQYIFCHRAALSLFGNQEITNS